MIQRFFINKVLLAIDQYLVGGMLIDVESKAFRNHFNQARVIQK